MELELKSKEVTQHYLEFAINNRNADITLTKHGACLWVFGINNGTDLTVEELIEICKSIYDSKVIDERDIILIYDTDDSAAYIRGSKEVENTILSSFFISSLIKRNP